MLNGQPLPEPSAQAEAKSPPPAFSALEIGRVYITPGALALGPERFTWMRWNATGAVIGRR